MDENSKIKKKGRKSHEENTCSRCLYFESHLPDRRPLKGNCTHHKEWIENASFTTCSDMSDRPLEPKGIYRLVYNQGEWSYDLRTSKPRTRLYLMKKNSRGR